jgi:RNA polymerase sigma factor (sigma-70 family)
VTSSSFDRGAETLLRELAPRVLGAVVRRFSDFAAAEDAVQEAFIAASVQWPEQGLPDNPRAWLIRVASRRMTDHVRSERARRRRESTAAEERAADRQLVSAEEGGGEADEDDTLLLLFMCCHPALTSSSAIALTLRAVGGLTTAEIARAFLVPEATMAQRISRAKQSIKDSGVPFRMPTKEERAERLRAVLHVLYLIFNEGYASSTGPALQRVELSGEAIRLARAVRHLLPDDAEVAGLLALMLLTDARRAARTGPGGELIPLDEQDRTLWDRRAIEEGVALVSHSLSRGSIGSYPLQAAIAALHDEAARVEDTDWPQILALYGLLERMSDNPDGLAQPGDRGGHGARPAGGSRTARRPPHRRPPGRPLPHGCRPGPPAGEGGRPRGRRRLLPQGGGPHREPSGAELPRDESGPAGLGGPLAQPLAAASSIGGSQTRLRGSVRELETRSVPSRTRFCGPWQMAPNRPWMGSAVIPG